MTHQQQRTLLIVDDSPEDRELYRRYLQRDQDYSYSFIEAKSGKQGLEQWQQQPVDLILLDYRLPDLDGLEFLAQLPAPMLPPCLPVIIVTGQGNETIAVQAIKAGAQDYLIKEQITPEGLQLAVNGAIATLQLRSQLQQRIERDHLISQITQKIHQSLDLEEILQTTVTEVQQFLQTDRVLIFRLQADDWGTVVKEAVGSAWTPLLGSSLHDPCIHRDYVESFRQGLVTLKSDIHDGSVAPCHVELLAKLQVRANLVVPILQNGCLWGMLIVHHCAAPRSWQPLEVELLKELATQVGIALRQADLHQQTQDELTERRRVETELRESEERFRTLADNMSQFAWMADASGWLFWYNQRWFEYSGTNLEEMQGWGWRRIHHPDHVDRVVQHFSRCIETGTAWEDTFPLRAKDGTYRWFLSRAIPIQDETGQTVCWFGTNTDIDDRKQAEESLLQSEERYRYLAELIPQLVWTTNAEGQLLDVNQRWSAFTGLTLEQARINGWEAVVHPDDLSSLSRKWTEAVQQGTPYQAEGRMRQADGQYRWHLHQAIPQKNEQGQVVKWFGTATDIEAQKQLEMEREHLLQREQTARLESEHANRSKDEFLAILSHELRSPLNPILGWTKLLQTRKFDQAKTTEALAIIERNVKLQAQLIDDLLDIAKILRGKLSIDTAPVNLTLVVEAAMETVRTAAISKSILLDSALPNIGQVSGDANRLQQIVWNLLSNAIKFTPQQGRVEVYLERIENEAQIVVSDTGRGISPDFLPYIFESFRQEDVTVTRQYGGLGLGLAIVRQLVEAHGGTIQAASPGEGLGATFTVRLPLLNHTAETQSADAPYQSLDLTGIRVLAVDDDPDARDLLAIILSEAGAEVLTVRSAADLLDNLESFQPDLLISDIGMPDVDGYTLMQQIRTLPAEKGGQTPAMALTAYARDLDQHRAISSGYQQHLTKPIEPDQLVQAVLMLIQHQ